MSEQQNPITLALSQAEKTFDEIAPAYLNFETEARFATQVLSDNQYLRKAAYEAPESLRQAVSNVAAIGLSLNPAERQAYLLPRNVKVGQNEWKTKIFLEPSYMGLVKLATDSGSIKWVQAFTVYANDEFFDNGPGEKPTHKYNAFAKPEDRGDFVGVYCVAKTAEGDFLTTTMPAAEVYDIRERSEAWKKWKSGPWATDFNEQAKKSVVRRAFKMWPRTNLNRMAQAVHLSNENEGFEPILTAPEMGKYTAEQKAYFDQMISQGNGLGMYVFQKTLNDDSAFTNLYHSFAKGEKGKYQRVVDELLKSGLEKAQNIAADLETATQDTEEAAAVEILEDLEPDQVAVIKDMLSVEANSFIASCQQAA